MDIIEIKLIKSQIESYEEKLKNSHAPLDISWYKSQIEYLRSKIKDMGD